MSPASAGLAFGNGGQSNAVGQDTDLTALGAPWPPVDTEARLKSFNGTTVSAADEPFNGVGGSHITPLTDKIARLVSAASQPLITGIPAPPVSSTSITQWAPGTANFLSMWGRLYTARQRLDYALAPLIWYQGETDTSDATAASLHASRTAAMFAAGRSFLGDPAFKIVVVRLHPTNPGFTYWTDVRSGQLTLADTNTIVVDSSGTLMVDNVHLTTAAQITLGATTIYDAIVAAGWAAGW